MIDILTYCDNHQKILKDKFFKPTFDLYLNKSFNHIDILYDTNLDNIQTFGFGSDVFQEMIFRRWYFLVDHIKQNQNTNKFSVFSDVDIVFLGDFYPNIKNMLASKKNIDVYFMAENPRSSGGYKSNFDINAGFFIFRHSKNTISFFENIIEFMSKQKLKEDQIYIREKLKQKYHPNISLLDSQVFATNNCPIKNNIMLRDQNKLRVFHATSCMNLYAKILVLDYITQPLKKQILEKIYEPK